MFKYLCIPALLFTIMTSCRNEEYIAAHNYVDTNDSDPYDASQVDLDSFPDWEESTHSNAVSPNYDEVFFADKTLQDEVLRIDLTISSSNWSSMQSDLSKNLSSSSNRMGMNDMNDLDFTPIWVPCTVTYNGTDWYQVGVRYKGNSSLSTTYTSGNDKLSLKLDFDEYEYNYPALTNQRFYGFKQLNLNNNYNDLSFMREKVASDLFRGFGMAAAHTSFCEVYINGDYFGLYTIVEEVDDSLIKDTTLFSQSYGNVYKPEDDAASFKSGTYDTSEFSLKTNTDNPDYSDVKALYDALHNSNRTSDTEAWMTLIESAFNVDVFMKWLAVNTTIQNWDTYGNMTHNYYLYNNPDDNKLTWIPWDHNEAFQSATGNYYTFTPEQLSNSRYTGSSWPLIYYLICIDEYKSIFDGCLRTFIDDVFEVTAMSELYTYYQALIEESVYAEEKGCTFLSYDSQFTSAVSTLKSHVSSRKTVIESYLE